MSFRVPRRQPDPGLPVPLRRFDERDWQEWLLDGPDPAAEGLVVPLEEWYAAPHPVEQLAGWANGVQTWRTVMVGIGDRPELVTDWRRYHAHKRWSHARVAWLKAHDLPWLDAWLDDLRFEHRMLRRDLRPAADTNTVSANRGTIRGRR